MHFKLTLMISALLLNLSVLYAEDKTAAASSGDSAVLIVAAVVFVIAVAAILIVQRRKKEEPTLPMIDEPAPVAEAPETAPAESVEETTTPPEVLTEPEPVAAPEPEAVPVPEEAAKQPEASPRKKRDLSNRPETVTKENLTEFAGNRILVAEDNMINQKVITKLLEESGIELVMAENGQIALDTLAKDRNFGMVLMDAHMLVKDGFEASREIRQNPLYESIVVVALSGDVSSDDIRKMKEAGMEEQLAKPLRIDALYDVLYQYLDLAERAEAAADEADASELNVFDTEEGLEVCGGDQSMYIEILDEFVQTYRNMDVLVDSFLASKDNDKLRGLMLDVHGVAGNIGADRLSYSSEMLREAVLDGQAAQYETLAVALKKDLQTLLSAIETYKASL